MKNTMRLITLVMSVLLMLLASGFTMAQADLTRQERAEIRFMEGMIDHHQMALDMANDCLAKTENETLKALCQAVIDAQTPEIEQMQAWLLEWYNIEYTPVPMAVMDDAGDSGHAAHGGHGGSNANQPFTDPAMMMGMMAGLNRLSGVDYDIAWLESMIDHHDDAIHMSERLLRRGAVHDELSELAQKIIDDQSAEIEQMEAFLEELN